MYVTDGGVQDSDDQCQLRSQRISRAGVIQVRYVDMEVSQNGGTPKSSYFEQDFPL
jgi:hypothetical protein